MDPNFRFLRIISRVFQGIAVLLACFFIAFPCASLFLVSNTVEMLGETIRVQSAAESFLVRVIGITLPGLITAIGFYTLGEMILLFLAIERNTRTMTELFSRRRSRQEPPNGESG